MNTTKITGLPPRPLTSEEKETEDKIFKSIHELHPQIRYAYEFLEKGYILNFYENSMRFFINGNQFKKL